MSVKSKIMCQYLHSTNYVVVKHEGQGQKRYLVFLKRDVFWSSGRFWTAEVSVNHAQRDVDRRLGTAGQV